MSRILILNNFEKVYPFGPIRMLFFHFGHFDLILDLEWLAFRIFGLNNYFQEFFIQ